MRTEIRCQLAAAIHIAPYADIIAGTGWNNKRLTPLRPIVLSPALKQLCQLLHILARRILADLCPCQLIQQQVTVDIPLRLAPQNQMNPQTQLSSQQSRRTTVIGLQPPTSDEGVATFRQSLGNHKLQLAYFIAGQMTASQIVPLDPYSRPSQLLRHPVKWLQRRWRNSQAKPIGKINIVAQRIGSRVHCRIYRYILRGWNAKEEC